jgi:hypothetical protein
VPAFYGLQLEQIEKARIIEAFFALTETDIATLSFRKPVKIRNQYFYLLEVKEFDPSRKATTRCKLLQL